MKLVCKNYGMEIPLLENQSVIFVIENPKAYSEILESFWNQTRGNGSADGLILSEDEKIKDISKELECIFNPFDLDCNNKKVLSKLYTELQEMTNINLIQEVAEINQNLVKFLDQVTNQVPYPIDFELELNLQALFKLYQVRVETEEGDLLNRVISYLKVMHRICNIKVYAFVGLKQYLQEEELRQLYEFVSYEKIFLIMLEAGESGRLDSEKYWILDRDLCIIEPS